MGLLKNLDFQIYPQIWHIWHKFSGLVQTTLPISTTPLEAEIPDEVAYADNVNFIGQNYADSSKIQELL